MAAPETAASMLIMADTSSTLYPEDLRSQIFVFSGSSVTAAGIPMPSFRMSLSLTPVTACSFSSVCSVNTSRVFFMSKNYVKDLEYHKTSSINEFPSGISISRNGSECLRIWKSPTGLSLRTFCHTTGIPLSPWGPLRPDRPCHPGAFSGCLSNCLLQMGQCSTAYTPGWVIRQIQLQNPGKMEIPVQHRRA